MGISAVIARLARTAFKEPSLIPSLWHDGKKGTGDLREQMRNLYSFTMDAKGLVSAYAITFHRCYQKESIERYSSLTAVFSVYALLYMYKEGQTGRTDFCQQIAAYLGNYPHALSNRLHLLSAVCSRCA